MCRYVGLLVAIVCVVVSGCETVSESGRQSQGDKILSSLSDLERQILIDKKVTRAEEQRALQIYTQCINDAGMQVVVDAHTSDKIGLDYVSVESAGESASDSSEKERARSACRNRIDAIDAVWVLQNAPTYEEIKLAESNLRKCVAHAGVKFDGEAGMDTVLAAIGEKLQRARGTGDLNADSDVAAAQECVRIYSDVAGKVPPPGLADALKKLK